ncbi:MAG TPA: SMP-30/gluconolactonase/LRE family protein [Pseudomonadales bacterium]|nr:SMP-30/gluconolactonase/LRE family protein [Pseudomonadales bacterium]
MTAGVQAQNLFVAASGAGFFSSNGSVIEITPDRTQSTFASGLSELTALAFNSAGNLFVASDGEGSRIIYQYTPAGAQTPFSPAEAAALAFNNSGDLFAGVGQSILEYMPGGTITNFARIGSMGLPEYNITGLAFDGAGNLFVSATQGRQGEIIEITPGGAQSVFASGLDTPNGLAFNSAGDLFVADSNGEIVAAGKGEIYEFSTGGVQSTFATGLDIPKGLAFDSSGDLFEADSGSGNVYEFSPGGTQSTVASGLSDPVSLAFQGGSLPVPEPSTMALLALGAGILCYRRR